MRRATSRAFSVWLGVGTLLAVLSTAGSQAQQVGTASAVNPDAKAGSRVLFVGSSIVFRERVSTTAAGSVHIVFIDKTTLSVGPNSNVVINEYVYNPNTGQGRMTVNLTKGAVRVVGGNVTHTGGATVKTPVATVGVRGGTTTIFHGKDTRAINHFGVATMTRGQETVMLKRPEFAATAPGGNDDDDDDDRAMALSAPERITAAEIDAAVRKLTTQPGQTGGKRTTPEGLKAAAKSAGSGETSARVPPPTFLPSAQGQTTSQDFTTHTFFKACCLW